MLQRVVTSLAQDFNEQITAYLLPSLTASYVYVSEELLTSQKESLQKVKSICETIKPILEKHPLPNPSTHQAVQDLISRLLSLD